MRARRVPGQRHWRAEVEAPRAGRSTMIRQRPRPSARPKNRYSTGALHQKAGGSSLPFMLASIQLGYAAHAFGSVAFVTASTAWRSVNSASDFRDGTPSTRKRDVGAAPANNASMLPLFLPVASSSSGRHKPRPLFFKSALQTHDEVLRPAWKSSVSESRRWRGIFTPSSRRGASKFDFHTACDVASVSESFVARTSP